MGRRSAAAANLLDDGGGEFVDRQHAVEQKVGGVTGGARGGQIGVAADCKKCQQLAFDLSDQLGGLLLRRCDFADDPAGEGDVGRDVDIDSEIDQAGEFLPGSSERLLDHDVVGRM